MSPSRIVVTGAAGFIGSHVAELLAASYPDARFVFFDKMTYAAHYENVRSLLERHDARLVVADLSDFEACQSATKGADLVVHLAAESHVDTAFGNSLLFTRTNVVGTHTLLEACRGNGVPRFIHVSTDEVYGEVLEGSATEDAPLCPTNPYSASKAGAEMLVRGYVRSYGAPVVVVRANNIYGIRQYPEKIIPKFTMRLLRGTTLPLHGHGGHRRRYLAVQDFAAALLLLTREGELGEAYNIGTEEEYSNVEVARMLCELVGVDPDSVLEHVADRPFNDARYAVSTAKIERMGWKPTRRLAHELPNIIEWYRLHGRRYREVFEPSARTAGCD